MLEGLAHVPHSDPVALPLMRCLVDAARSAIQRRAGSVPPSLVAELLRAMSQV